MDQKTVLTNLGRVKAHYNKGNSLEALNTMILALSEVVRVPSTSVPTSLRSALRESIQLITRDKTIMEGVKAPIIYSPGQELPILKVFLGIQKRLVDGPQETREEAKARKLKIDKAYTLGIRLLEANKVSEADQVFQEAIKSYKDEFRIFTMITNALVDAGQNVRASGYVKKAIELNPDSEELKELLTKIKG